MTEPRPWAVRAFPVLAWALVVSVVAQVALAGIALMSDPTWWPYHVSFVHVFEMFPVAMAIVAFAGRLPRLLGWASVALFFLIGFQYAFVGMRPSMVASLHVIDALLIFGLAFEVARRSARSGPLAIA